MKKSGPGKALSGSKADQTQVLSGPSQKQLILKKARFKVTGGRDAGKEMVLQKTHVSIGTLPENDLVLTDATVSRKHAVVEERPDGYLLRDLGSTNGSFLDNEIGRAHV